MKFNLPSFFSRNRKKTTIINEVDYNVVFHRICNEVTEKKLADMFLSIDDKIKNEIWEKSVSQFFSTISDSKHP